MKLNINTGPFALIAAAVVLTSGCDSGPKSMADGGTIIGNGVGDFCKVYIIEKEGHRFAVAVGSRGGCSIIEIK